MGIEVLTIWLKIGGGNEDLYEIINDLCLPDGGDQMGIGRHKKPGALAGF